ncbi:MAG: toxin-antitoxin system HicB family antitoxin [Chthoniobacteraceae bacterium]
MSTVSVRIPDSVKRHVERLAAKDGISVDQFYATAAAEKLAALETADYIAQRAARADREAFLRVLAKVPDAEPEAWDRLPE